MAANFGVAPGAQLPSGGTHGLFKVKSWKARKSSLRAAKGIFRAFQLLIYGAAYWNHTTSPEHSVNIQLSAACAIRCGVLISMGGVRGGVFY